MDFLKTLAADVKASTTKTATNLYTASIGKATDAANKLFGTYTGGQAADFAKGTIPSTAAPQPAGGSTPNVPLAPAAIAGAALQPDYSRILLIAAAVAIAAVMMRE